MSKRGENIYKRKDGRWEGRYIKCRTLHGRIQYGYVYGKSYSAVKSKLKETASMPIQTSDSRATQPTSYSEILKMWLLSTKNHVKESTFSRYNHLVERHIQSFLGGYQIGEISNALLEKYIDHLLQCGRLDGSGGLSPKSVSDILVVIKRSMRYAQENNHLVICSTAGLSVKRSRNNMRVLSKIEQRQLEYVLMQDMDLTKFTVLLCLYTGIRIGEACALRWEHIRLDSGILEVRETMQRIQAPQNMASKTRITISESLDGPIIEHTDHDESFDVLFDNFGLTIGGKEIIRSFTFLFETGKKYLIVGLNGSGKSTLFKALKKWYGAFADNIKINGKSVSNISNEELSKCISYLNENVSLFSGSVRDNITLFREYSPDVFSRAVDDAQVNLDLDRVVNDEGRNISSGEQRRIEIARSLLSSVKMIVFDEVVSTLDIETAYEIEKMALDFKDKTVVFISHNFSGKLIRNYDDILVVQNGSLLTHGTYNELINSCDYFRRICEIKFGDIR